MKIQPIRRPQLLPCLPAIARPVLDDFDEDTVVIVVEELPPPRLREDDVTVRFAVAR